MPKPNARIAWKRSRSVVAYLLLAFFTALMLEITFRYIPFHTDVAFLQIKQTEANTLPYYIPVFYAHVYTAIFCLFAGFTQFSKRILKSHKTLHRSMGYLYVVVVLAFAAPSGLVMGFHANGGAVAVFFFVVLAILWWWFTFKALYFARKKDFIKHKKFMYRSYALALSAITLRLWKLILVKLFHPAPMDVYVIVSGLGWIPNLLFVELLIKNKFFLSNKKINL